MKKIIEKYSKTPEGLFKTIFVTYLFGFVPFALLHIILNLFKVVPVNFNNNQIYGIKGIIVIILFTPLFVLMFTIFSWAYFMIGNLILRFLKKTFYE
jgi:hypothetical protein